MIQEEIRNLTKFIISKITELVLKTFPQRNQAQKASLANFIIYLMKKPYQFWKGGKTTSQLILQGLHFPDTKARQRYCKKTTGNHPYVHWCKNTQQNTEFSSILKGLYIWPYGIYSWSARMAQHVKADQWNTPHHQNERETPCNQSMQKTHLTKFNTLSWEKQ